MNVVQGAFFGLSGESLTKKVRSRLFESILRQELAWFEKEENNTGALCASLSNEACKVQGATGVKVGSFLQGFSGILFAIAIGLYYNLILGAVAIAFLPALIGMAVYSTKKSLFFLEILNPESVSFLVTGGVKK